MRKSYFMYWIRTASGEPYATTYFWRGSGVGGAGLSALGLDGGGGFGDGAYCHVGGGEGDGHGTGDGGGRSSALCSSEPVTLVITLGEP